MAHRWRKERYLHYTRSTPPRTVVNHLLTSPNWLAFFVSCGQVEGLLEGSTFLGLRNYYKKYGSVFKLLFGPKSFIVISDPTVAKHILRDNAKAYDKGILAEILEPIMGKGLIPADPETWKVRRKAIVPGFHKVKLLFSSSPWSCPVSREGFSTRLCFFVYLLDNQAWYNAMVKVFTDCNVPLIDKLTQAAKDGSKVRVCCV